MTLIATFIGNTQRTIIDWFNLCRKVCIHCSVAKFRLSMMGTHVDLNRIDESVSQEGKIIEAELLQCDEPATLKDEDRYNGR